MNEEKSIADRIKQLEKDISSAETRVEMYEQRLEDLKTSVQENETNCKNELKMTIKELPTFIKDNEAQVLKDLKALEAERDKINEGQEE
jgi:predicted component of type VI protein secretion system